MKSPKDKGATSARNRDHSPLPCPGDSTMSAGPHESREQPDQASGQPTDLRPDPPPARDPSWFVMDLLVPSSGTGIAPPSLGERNGAGTRQRLEPGPRLRPEPYLEAMP